MNQLPLKKISLTIALPYAVAIAVIMFHSAGGDLHPGGLLFLAWVISPQLLLLRCVTKFSAYRWKMIALVMQLVLGVVSLYGYYDTMYVHTDAQGALVFIFLPLWQNVAILVMTGVRAAFSFREKPHE